MSLFFLAPEARKTENTLRRAVFDLIMKTYFNIVFNGHIGEKSDVLKRSRNAHLVYLRGRFARGVLAVYHDNAACGLINLCKKIENRGLARTVGTYKTRNFRFTYREVEILNRVKSAEINAEVSAFESGSLVDVSFGHYGMRRNGNHFSLLKLIHSVSLLSLPCGTGLLSAIPLLKAGI